MSTCCRITKDGDSGGVQALRKVPQVNASWRGEFIREFTDINIGVAVQTDVGLLVPVLPNADAKGLGDISKGVKALAGKVVLVFLSHLSSPSHLSHSPSRPPLP